MKKRILLLAPSAWDLAGINKPEFQAKYEFIPVPMAFYQTHPLLIGVRFDIMRFIAKAVRLGRELGVAGIVGTHDYPASLAAAAIAAELGLPGPAVDKAIVCQHKYLCRLKQRDIVPEAAPAFGLIDPLGFSPRRAPLEFPIFVKPVKATLSMFAGEAGNERELAKLIKLSPLERLGGLIALRPFNRLIEAYTDFKTHANYFIAEEVLRGAQVTVEGFAHRGRLEIMGVVDSVMYPGTLSFERFEYPSRLPLPIQERMESLALRLMSSIGFGDGCFNVEMIYNAGRDSVHIIEVNPRMCSQFSDLYEKVDGTSGHAVQMAIASGERPSFSRRAGKYRAAASFVLRTFEDRKVLRVPSQSEIAAVAQRFPGTLVMPLCRKNAWLSCEPQDRESFRYAAVNMGSTGFDELQSSFRAALAALPFEFAGKALKTNYRLSESPA